MNVGVNYMREHMPSDARIHYAYLDTGGIAPNVVQGTAKIRYAVRARDLAEMQQLNDRVRKIAQGAALMTETKVEVRIVSAAVSQSPARSSTRPVSPPVSACANTWSSGRRPKRSWSVHQPSTQPGTVTVRMRLLYVSATYRVRERVGSRAVP